MSYKWNLNPDSQQNCEYGHSCYIYIAVVLKYNMVKTFNCKKNTDLKGSK